MGGANPEEETHYPACRRSRIRGRSRHGTPVMVRLQDQGDEHLRSVRHGKVEQVALEELSGLMMRPSPGLSMTISANKDYGPVRRNSTRTSAPWNNFMRFLWQSRWPVDQLLKRTCSRASGVRTSRPTIRGGIQSIAQGAGGSSLQKKKR